jgi:D-beta-D-heptose 7-phosphate kinase/D-beta-D-heptose 1-phosphate adenosyltransferase
MVDLLKRWLGSTRREWATARFLVVGDLMLDRYLWGDVARISPEAPVPVVRLTSQTERCGGAANVALNLAGLGLRVAVAGFVGTDPAGDTLVKLLADSGVEVGGVVRVSERATITKTRVIGGHQQMLRIDAEHDQPVTLDELHRLEAAVWRELALRPSAVVLSDYAKGALAPEICAGLIREARRSAVPVFVDPKGHDWGKYAGATGMTPNRAELALACGLPGASFAELLEAGQRLREHLGLDFIAVTRGEEGISLIRSSGVSHSPAVAKSVFDVSGAGDTVIAVTAAGVVAGLGVLESIHVANVAAGIVIGKIGTAPIERDELLQALSTERTLEQAHKICDIEEALRRVERWRASGERVVFTNGCFDLIHLGHVTFLERARREGDRLVVGVNSDRSVRSLKGPSRPVIPAEERARVLAALECVDGVVIFDQDTPLDLIQRLRPEVLAKGADCCEDEVIGAGEIRRWNGRVCLIPLVPGYSSRRILERIEAVRSGNS